MSTQTISVETALEGLRKNFVEEEVSDLFKDIMRAALTEEYSVRNFTPGEILKFVNDLHLILTAASFTLNDASPEEEIKNLFTRYTADEQHLFLTHIQEAALSAQPLNELTDGGAAFEVFDKLREYVLSEY